MPTQEWSDEIYLTELEADPAFSDDIASLLSRIDSDLRHVVLDMSKVRSISSSNISQMLRVRKVLIERDRKLILSGCTDSVWSVMLTTGLDKVFHFADAPVTALASLQMG